MTHLSTLALHQLRLGELPHDEARAASQHLDDCARCRARMDAAEADDAAVATEPLPAFLAELDARPAPPPQPSRSEWARWLDAVGMPAVAVLAAAILVLVALPVTQAGPAEHTSGIRTRGVLPELEVWVQAPDGHRPLRVGEALGEGDEVVLFYHPHEAASVALAGRDRSGEVELYKVLRPVKPGLQPAPFALNLDDAPGVQEFFVVAGDRDLSEASARQAIEGMADSVTRVVVPKEPRR